MNDTISSSTPRPWYKEPWPWILMAGPALAIVGCVVTIYFAMTRFADEPIHDGGVRRGLVVERIEAVVQSIPGN